MEIADYFTVKVAVLLVTVPEDAVMLADVPDTAVETTVATPAEVIVATVLSLESQVTEVVIGALVPLSLIHISEPTRPY